MRIVREVFQPSCVRCKGVLSRSPRLVHVSITRATSAFNDSDVALAEVVIAEDAKIDEAALALDESSPSTSSPASSRSPATCALS